MSVSIRDRLRYRLRSSLPALMAWYVGRGLLPVRHARRIWRSGRQFRTDTQGGGALAYEVIVRDDHRMTTRTLEPADVIVDVGGHIGLFGLVAHACGSRAIWSYEAGADSYQKMRENYEDLAGGTALHGAVFRSDSGRPEKLRLSGAASIGTVLFDSDTPMEWIDGEIVPARSQSSEEVQTIPLDEILGRHESVRILKVDCEGSEFPILLTSELLDRVDEIIGECHEISAEIYSQLAPSSRISGMSAFRLRDLTDCLEGQGFTVEATRSGRNNHLFQARRK